MTQAKTVDSLDIAIMTGLSNLYQHVGSFSAVALKSFWWDFKIADKCLKALLHNEIKVFLSTGSKMLVSIVRLKGLRDHLTRQNESELK